MYFCCNVPKVYQTISTLLLILGSSVTQTQAADWQFSGSLFINTTSEGASIPAEVSIEHFPLLVRLHQDWFDFSQAQNDGSDVRFFTAQGVPIGFQIEDWSPASGNACIWVRIPEIRGQEIQEIKMQWGNPEAESQSNGQQVFNDSNGYLSVWHMGETVQDEVGTLSSEDTGTSETQGIVGNARHFQNRGVFCGDQNKSYPCGE